MVTDRGKELQEIHNAGQTDASAGRRHFPHDSIDEIASIFGLTGSTSKEVGEDNAAYQTGRDNYNATKK